ncbi:MAG: hypothetical protein H6898_16395 [Rhodobacter sp.]|nr:hypothetical protein [Paracoccaceae bacterium]MCC0078137.1 hypothetical protein [Rhodobacter sp.]
MKPALVSLMLLAAAPASAQTLSGMLGSWSGEGVAARGDEPGDRFRCRISLRPEGVASALFAGRCATAQGQQTFTYLVIERDDGTVSAQNRSEPPDELPQRLSGTAQPGLLRLDDGSGSLFEFRLQGDDLRLRIEGSEAGRPTRGEAHLTRQERS